MRNCESEEMYLETILLLSRQNGSVRRVDIAVDKGVSKPSVTTAIKLLKAKEYICDDEQGVVQLTDAGRRRAEAIYERHHLLMELLMHIGAEASDAEDNACRM